MIAANLLNLTGAQQDCKSVMQLPCPHGSSRPDLVEAGDLALLRWSLVEEQQ